MKRRDFIVNTVGIVGFSLLQIHCGGSSSDNSTPNPTGNNQQSGNPTCSGGAGITYTNPGHGHIINILCT